jgi:hypothetical protein
MSPAQYGRKDKLIKEKCHDAYRESGKWPEPTVCTDCRALYISGRWSWKGEEESAHEAICPACRRISDNYPAGYIEVGGPFFKDRRADIISLIIFFGEKDKGEHPLEIIISTEEESDRVLITTTGIHVARRIGEALSRAYKGDLSFRYAKDDDVIRVCWKR